ncbi:BTAD domain-containing putative transcriptional regulator [Streptomyces diastatochromogenes]|nr:BTAD domain-containing putative transcriptional regulator [Streptomyces diastatochromogenes]
MGCLSELTGRHPMREHAHALLMRALRSCGRPRRRCSCTKVSGGASPSSSAWTPASRYGLSTRRS